MNKNSVCFWASISSSFLPLLNPKLSEDYLKLLSGEKSSLNENQINNASNMLEHFIKKLNLILTVDDLKNLEDEFQNEIKKYF